MTLIFRLLGWKHSPVLQQLVERDLGRLERDVQVTLARIVLEHRRDATPSWSARAHLEVPGPDLRAEARDHTVQAAWRKVVGELKTLVRHRQDNRRQHADERRRIRPLARAL